MSKLYVRRWRTGYVVFGGFFHWYDFAARKFPRRDLSFNGGFSPMFSCAPRGPWIFGGKALRRAAIQIWKTTTVRNSVADPRSSLYWFHQTFDIWWRLTLSRWGSHLLRNLSRFLSPTAAVAAAVAVRLRWDSGSGPWRTRNRRRRCCRCRRTRNRRL